MLLRLPRPTGTRLMLSMAQAAATLWGHSTLRLHLADFTRAIPPRKIGRISSSAIHRMCTITTLRARKSTASTVQHLRIRGCD